MNRFSFFHAPVSNVTPCAAVGLEAVCDLIRSDSYRPATEELRRLRAAMKEGRATQRDVQRFKARCFDYVTFSGLFSRRSAREMKEHSGLLCLDFDHVDTWQGAGRLCGVYGLRYVLLEDAAVDTALLFRSSGGDGLKWVVPIDLRQGTHDEWFRALSFYAGRTYGIEPDPSGCDVARACYLPWDPDAVIKIVEN